MKFYVLEDFNCPACDSERCQYTEENPLVVTCDGCGANVPITSKLKEQFKAGKEVGTLYSFDV
jgi:hypothetical protein